MGFRCHRVERSWMERRWVERSALNGGSGTRLGWAARVGIPVLANRPRIWIRLMNVNRLTIGQ